MNINKKEFAKTWFRNLRNKIFHEFELIEKEYQEKMGISKESKFHIKEWKRGDGDEGGGEIGLMYGNVFESVGVNISTVYGKFEPKFAAEMKDSGNGSFWASGISLVAHMCSPKIPAVHFNTRFICTQSEWFGGGADLTPLYEDEEDTKNFHQAFQNACDKFNSKYYPEFKKNCDEYFYLPHRKEPRGIGGIFYDYLNSGNFDEYFAKNKLMHKKAIEYIKIHNIYTEPKSKFTQAMVISKLKHEKARKLLFNILECKIEQWWD